MRIPQIGGVQRGVMRTSSRRIGTPTWLQLAAGLPEGAVHVAQELSFVRSVSPGEALTASARVLSRGERQGWVLMGVDLTVADDSGASVMNGRATLTFPMEAEV